MFPLLAAEKLRSQLTIFSNLYETQSEPQHNIGHMHKLIFEAYKAGDIDKAGELMKKHLDDSLQYALSCLYFIKYSILFEYQNILTFLFCLAIFFLITYYRGELS